MKRHAPAPVAVMACIQPLMTQVVIEVTAAHDILMCMIQSPENIVLPCDVKGVPFAKPVVLTNKDRTAVTICVLNMPAAPVVITTTSGAHMFIYNAVKLCAEAAKPSQWKAILQKHGCKVVHGTLDDGVVQRFHALMEREHNFPRYNVVSARLWQNIAVPGHDPFSVLAFWNGQDFADQTVMQLLVETLLSVKTLHVEVPFYMAHFQDETAAWRQPSLPES